METSDGGRGFTQQCCSCDAPSARCWCVECNEALCDACVSAHGRVTVTRSHRILNQPPAAASAGHVSTPPIKFCRLHPSERLILFCFTCGRLTCRDCQLMDHMNHRYQFVREAVNSLKKQLEACVQPIRAQRSTVRQSLRELQIRLQDIAESESHLISELQNSYTVICRHMKQRVEMLSQQARSVCETESSKIRRSVERLRRLQLGQQSLIDAAQKAATSDDVPTLLASTAQVRSELRTLADQDSSPPSLMSQMKVVTDAQFMETLLKFGELEVSWIPFSVSQTSNQSRVAPAASNPPPPSSSSSGALPPVPLNTSSSTRRSIAPSSALQTTPPSGPSSSAVTTVSLLGTNVSQVVMNKSAQPVTFAVNLSAAPPSSCTLNNYLQSPVVVNPPAARQQLLQPRQQPQQPQVVLLSNNQMMYQVFPMMSNQQILPVATNCASFTCSAPSLKPLPQATPTIVAKTLFQNNSLAVSWKSSTSEAGPCPSNTLMPPLRADITTAPAPQTSLQLHQTVTDLHPVTDKPPPPYSSALASLTQSQSKTDLHPLKDETAPPSSSSPSDVTPGPCQSAVVRAVADSACDLSAQQVTARPPESGENEPTSTVYEETDPAEKPSEPSSVIGRTVDTLNQWQPTVSLVRLPVSLPKPGRPLPGFNLVPGEEEDEIYLEEMSEDTQSSVDDVTDDVIEQPSSPESPVTLETVNCSACGSANGSIICSACGRGYHRDTCHVPPVGLDLMSEWTCSLCQDLSDPSDPYSSDRPHRPQSPGLSVLDQRKCESLLLHLKVEGCSRLSESPAVCSDLEEISKRLTRHRAPSYQSAAEFLSDVWRLFDHMKDDDAVKKLQESFQSRCEELHPSVLKSDGGTSAAPETLKKLEVNVDKSKLTSMRKRLRDLLMTTASKKIKMEDKPRLPGTSKQPITDIPVISLLDD